MVRRTKSTETSSVDPNTYIIRALEHAAANPGAAFAQFEAAGLPRRLSTGWRVVPLQQMFCGVPVLHGVRAVRFDDKGKVVAFTGTSLAIPEHTPIVPRASATEAARVAFVELLRRRAFDEQLSFTASPPTSIAELGPPTYTTVLSKDPLTDAILAALVIDASRRKPFLVWEVRIRAPESAGAYIVRVEAAGTRDLPKVRDVISASSSATRARVFEFDPRTPPVTISVPRDLAFYPFPTSPRKPRLDWVHGGETRGNNARVLVRGACVPGITRDGDLVFDAQPGAKLEEAAINAFYLCNTLHDFFYSLGFDEGAGNFQLDNEGSDQGEGDPVEVLIQDREVSGMGAFANRTDGKFPTLELGLHPSGRHAALDAHLVIHEFAHGVTNRIVGASRNRHTPLEHEQSLAIGEGLSDYWAITIQNYYRRRLAREVGADPQAAQEWQFAPWLASGGATGLRSHSYQNHPGRLRWLRRPRMDAHTAGEVWCATLLDLNRALGAGDLDLGDCRGWRLVLDSLALLHVGPKGPNFLHARNSVLCAFDVSVAAGVLPGDAPLRQAVLDVFTQRGMGGDARSDGAWYRSVKEGGGAIGTDYRKDCK